MFIFDILCKTFIQAKPLRIWFNKIDGFIKIYDEITYLVFLIMKNIMDFLIGLIIFQIIKSIDFS